MLDVFTEMAFVIFVVPNCVLGYYFFLFYCFVFRFCFVWLFWGKIWYYCFVFCCWFLVFLYLCSIHFWFLMCLQVCKWSLGHIFSLCYKCNCVALNERVTTDVSNTSGFVIAVHCLTAYVRKNQNDRSTDIEIWTNKIPRDLSLRWVSEGYLGLQQPPGAPFTNMDKYETQHG